MRHHLYLCLCRPLAMWLGAWVVFGATFAAAQTTKPAPPKPAPADALAPAHTEVRHHGALGVLVSKSPEGLQVVGLIPGGAASRAGMHIGDEIRYVGDERVHTVEQLSDEIKKYAPNARVDLMIRRNGEREIVKARLAAAPATEANGAAATNPGAPAGDNASLAEQMQQLQRQISRMQRQIDQLHRNQSGRISRQQNMRDPDWGWNGRGEMDDDPALFQQAIAG